MRINDDGTYAWQHAYSPTTTSSSAAAAAIVVGPTSFRTQTRQLPPHLIQPRSIASSTNRNNNNMNVSPLSNPMTPSLIYPPATVGSSSMHHYPLTSSTTDRSRTNSVNSNSTYSALQVRSSRSETDLFSMTADERKFAADDYQYLLRYSAAMLQDAAGDSPGTTNFNLHHLKSSSHNNPSTSLPTTTTSVPVRTIPTETDIANNNSPPFLTTSRIPRSRKLKGQQQRNVQLQEVEEEEIVGIQIDIEPSIIEKVEEDIAKNNDDEDDKEEENEYS
jgi:hypothetical protein